MAEREGFEPPVPLRALRISSATRSTTLPPLREGILNPWSAGVIAQGDQTANPEIERL